MSGLVKCPVCGSAMIFHRTAKKGKVGEYYRYYQCSNFFNKGSNVCKSNLVNAGIAETYVLDKINQIVLSKEILNVIIKKVETNCTTDTSSLENNIKALNKEYKEINVEIESNLNQYKNNFKLNKSEKISLIQMNGVLNERKDEIQNKIDTFKNELNNINTQFKIQPKMIKTILENFLKLFEKANLEKKKILLKSIIESISVTNGKSARDRKIDKIKLYFEPQEVEALNYKKKFATTYDTVHP
ncbi:zinc ribbon domain-containing protein [Clostridium sp. ZS2-4]|nr:zinc ribbon domain-containing protein [Clostridium sp. ZS2-4]